MATGVKIEGLKELEKQLTNVLPREAKNLMRGATSATASRVARAARAKAPIRSGGLKKSIIVKRRSIKFGRLAVDVIAKRPEGAHWHLIEYGTQGYAPRNIPPMPAQPFAGPAVQEISLQIPQIFREEFGKKLERLMARKAARNA